MLLGKGERLVVVVGVQQNLFLHTHQFAGVDQRFQHLLKVFHLREAGSNLVGRFRGEAALQKGVFNFLLVVVLLYLKVGKGNAVVDILEHLAVDQRIGDLIHHRDVLVLDELVAELVLLHALTQRIFLVVAFQQFDGAVL